MKTKLSLSKMVGVLSTTTLITASVAPNTLHIPLLVRPWVFIATVAWTLLITSGVFTE